MTDEEWPLCPDCGGPLDGPDQDHDSDCEYIEWLMQKRNEVRMEDDTRKKMTIDMSEEVWVSLKYHANKRKVSVSEYMRKAVSLLMYIDDHPRTFVHETGHEAWEIKI